MRHEWTHADERQFCTWARRMDSVQYEPPTRSELRAVAERHCEAREAAKAKARMWRNIALMALGLIAVEVALRCWR